MKTKREPVSLSKLSKQFKAKGYRQHPPKLEYTNIRKLTLTIEYTK